MDRRFPPLWGRSNATHGFHPRTLSHAFADTRASFTRISCYWFSPRRFHSRNSFPNDTRYNNRRITRCLEIQIHPRRGQLFAIDAQSQRFFDRRKWWKFVFFRVFDIFYNKVGREATLRCCFFPATEIFSFQREASGQRKKKDDGAQRWSHVGVVAV